MPNLHIFGTITEAISIITSRQRLKQFISTSLYRNASYLIINAAVTGLFSFFFWIVVARFYDDVAVGYSAAIISATTFLATISMFGFNFSLIRFLPQAKNPQQLINSCIALSGIISLVVAGIFLVGVDFWSPALSFVKETFTYSAIFIILTLILTLAALVGGVFIAKRRAHFVLYQNIIISVIKIFLPLLFVLFFHSFGIVASWVIASGIALTISLFLFLPKAQSHYKLRPTLKLNITKDIWKYSGSNYVLHIFMVAPFMLLPIIVVNLLGAEQNAYFYIAWMIATSLFHISTGISLSLLAEGSHFEDKLKENTIKSLKFTFLLLIPAIIAIILIGKWLLLVFGQNYSANALYLLWVLAVSSLPASISFIYTSILRVTKRIKELVIIWGVIALVVLGVSYLIIPSVGIIGIGYAWLGTHCLVAIYVITSGRRLWQKGK